MEIESASCYLFDVRSSESALRGIQKATKKCSGIVFFSAASSPIVVFKGRIESSHSKARIQIVLFENLTQSRIQIALKFVLKSILKSAHCGSHW